MGEESYTSRQDQFGIRISLAGISPLPELSFIPSMV